jgi:hypothetical protein
MTTRTITSRVLLARAREHGRVLRTLGDGAEWSVLTWSEAVGDPEWVYHVAAHDACRVAATRFHAGAHSLRDHGVDDLRSNDCTPSDVVLRGAGVLGPGSGNGSIEAELVYRGGSRPSGGAAWRVFGRLGGARESHRLEH